MAEKRDLVLHPHTVSLVTITTYNRTHITHATRPSCYQTFVLADLHARRPSCSQTFMLPDLHATRPSCSQTFMLADLRARRPSCYQTFMLQVVDHCQYTIIMYLHIESEQFWQRQKPGNKAGSKPVMLTNNMVTFPSGGAPRNSHF